MSWPSSALGDVCPAKPLKKPKFSGSDIVWQLNLDQIEANSGTVLSKLRAPVCEAGGSTHWYDEQHVLYSKLRPYLNKVVLPDEPGIATTELVPLLPNPERLDRKYLAYYLRSNGFLNWISTQVAGAKMPRVSMKVFWEHQIPLPPLPEQKRIAAILDKADSLRRKRQQAIELADQFLRALFLDMFGDPVTNLKGWQVCPLSDIALIQIGPFGTQLHREDYVSDGIPLINPTHIVSGKIVHHPDLAVGPEKYDELPQYRLIKDDIVMARRGEMGRCALVSDTEDGWLCGTGSLIVRPYSKGVFSEYLYNYLTSDYVKRHLESECLGATMPNLNKTIVGSIRVPIPDKAVMTKYQRMRDSLYRIYRYSHEFQREDLFHSVSGKLLSGA